MRAFASLTVRSYAFHVLSFLRFCDERQLALAAVTPMDVFDFLDWLAAPSPSGTVVSQRCGGCSSSLSSLALATTVRSQWRAGPRERVRSDAVCSVMSRRGDPERMATWYESHAGCPSRWTARILLSRSAQLWEALGCRWLGWPDPSYDRLRVLALTCRSPELAA